MSNMRIFHYSEEPDIKIFNPRAPLRHPDSKPLVYAIDEWHSPLYYFPRDCPRVGIWPLPTTTQDDLERFKSHTTFRMLLAIDETWSERLQTTQIYQYEFATTGFTCTNDHGCWVSDQSQTPTKVTTLNNLPLKLSLAQVQILVVPNLARWATQWLTPASLHVSMIRMSYLPDWQGKPGTPVSMP